MILWGGSTNGPSAPPGKYTVRLTADGKTVTQPLVVKRNPMHEATDADLQAQFALAIQLRDKVSEANVVGRPDRATSSARSPTASRSRRTRSSRPPATSCRRTSTRVEEEIYQVRNQSGQDPLNFPIKVNNRLAALLGVVSRGDAKPIASAYPIFGDLKGELKSADRPAPDHPQDRPAGVQRRGQAAGPRADRDQQANSGFLAVF